MSSDYMQDRIVLGAREVYLQYGKLVIATSVAKSLFTPEETLALSQWLQAHQSTIQESLASTRAKDKAAREQTTNVPGDTTENAA